MSRNRAILLTILGIVAAWFIIRGINAWAEKHKADESSLVPSYKTALCVQTFPAVEPSAGISIF